MNRFKQFEFLFICLLLSPLFSRGNAGMPGFWNLGGSTGFLPLFARDSLYLDKIQMQSEEVHILLYKGFAVVKGEYYFKNLSDRDILLNVGYPINTGFESKQVFTVHFRDLYQLKVLDEGTPTKTKKLEDKESTVFRNLGQISGIENWYVWESLFKKGELHKITVYFMVETNAAALIRGYSRDYNNGFTYLLESGRAWAKKIEKGKIFIHLMNGLKSEEIMGIAPNAKFNIDPSKKTLLYEFTSLEPDQNDNILLRYTYGNQNFNIKDFIQKAENYYKTADQKQSASTKLQHLKPFSASDFEIHDWKGTLGFTLAMFVMVFGFPVLIILIGLTILFAYLRRKKQQK